MTSNTPTVLVVDDEPAMLDLYTHFVSDTCSVRTAGDGADALDRIDDTVDVVLLDRRMPDMSGDDVLDSLRTQGYSCPVAMVSAVEPEVDVIELGFDEYLVKPVTRDELLDLIETLHSRATYDDVVREYFAIASKQALLETEMTIETLEDSGEYAELSRQREELHARARSRLSQMSDEEFSAVFRTFGHQPGGTGNAADPDGDLSSAFGEADSGVDDSRE